MKLCAAAGSMVLIAGISACGGGSSYGSSHAAVPPVFQAKAAAVCKKAVAQKRAAGSFPYPKFNPTRPDWPKFPGVARALANTPMRYRTWQNDMRALGEPSTGRAAWDDLLAAIAAHVHIATEQEAAAVRKDSRTFTKDYNQGNETQKKLIRAARVAGLPDCAAVDR